MERPLDGKLPEISHRLLAWFFAHRRDLPWRGENDPYRIWVSETMLQQTRCETVGAYYPPFLERFPDLAALARADEQEVLKAWEGLGYYGRARSLHRAARVVMERHGGRLPDEPEAFRALPGVGDYTEAAVLSIAYARPLGVADGNVIRVVARLLADPGRPSSAALRARVRRFVEASFQNFHPGWVNQAWMELGALVCRPAPDCPACPLAFACRALELGRVRDFPVRRPPSPLPVRREVLFLLFPARCGVRLRAELASFARSRPAALGRRLLGSSAVPLLLARRPSRGLLGGLWELPNAPADQAVTFAAAYGVELSTAPEAEVRHRYSHFEAHSRLRLGFFGGEVLPNWVEQRWVRASELDRYPRPQAHIKAFRVFGLQA